MTIKPEHPYRDSKSRDKKSWLGVMGVPLAVICNMILCGGICVAVVDPDFSRCSLRFPPANSNAEFSVVVQDIAILTKEHVLLVEHEPARIHYQCGCAYGKVWRTYGTNQSPDEILAVFKLAMSGKKWNLQSTFERIGLNQQKFEENVYADPQNKFEFTVEITDPTVDLRTDKSVIKDPRMAPSADPSTTQPRFRTNYSVSLRYVKPSPTECYSG